MTLWTTYGVIFSMCLVTSIHHLLAHTFDNEENFVPSLKLMFTTWLKCTSELHLGRSLALVPVCEL